MAKNDVVVRTATDLERKYNLGSIGGMKKNIEITAQGIQELQNELYKILTTLVINLKDILDSQSEISLWFYSGIPTTKNEPYTNWTTPSDHIGDIYYDQSSGYVYQYKEVDGAGIWESNVSPDLVEAMAITNSELDTATDHERRVFFDTPTIPYSNGDWWVKEDGSLFICQLSKTTGIFEENDFISSNSYTESIAEKLGDEIKVLKGTITQISENFAKFTDLATGKSTTISGDNITSGSLQSNNYINNVSGTKLSLDDGTIDTKNFKVDVNGNVTCNNATVKGTAILNGDKFQVDKEGNIIANGGIIGGFTLDDTSLSVNVSKTFSFTQDDLTKVRQYLIGQITLTDEEFNLYDVDGDGLITIFDMTFINKCVTGYYPNQTITGKFKISSNSINKCIEIEGGSTAIGLNGVTSDRAYFGSLNTPRITVQDFDNPTDRDNIVDIQPSGITVGGNCLVKGLYSGIVALGNNDTYMHVETSSGSKGITWWDSDRKLKTNIKDSNVNALDVIKQIKHREYDRTDRKEHSKIGYVAQELQGIDESLVFEVKQQDGVKILNINQPNLIPYLTKAIQEQQEMIDLLKEEIKNLKEG